MNIALLIIRLVLGLAIARHGAEKLFGWFGGYGIDGTAGFFEQLGWRPGKLFVLGAGGAELIGGLLTVFGFGGPIGPALIVMVMIVAIFAVHASKGFAAQAGGYELNVMYIIAALAPAFAMGEYSLDGALGLTGLQTPANVWIALAIAAVLAGLNLLSRSPRPADAAHPTA